MGINRFLPLVHVGVWRVPKRKGSQIELNPLPPSSLPSCPLLLTTQIPGDLTPGLVPSPRRESGALPHHSIDVSYSVEGINICSIV